MTRTMVRLPEPQIHRRRSFTARKLNKDEKANKTPYLMVPRFFDMYHPTTTWLINTVVSENEKELERVLSDKETNSLLKFDPDPMATQTQRTVMSGKKDLVITKAKYFQILDRPEMYDSACSFAPLFSRHTVMYLTPLGLAIYLRKMKSARQLVECINRDTNKKHVLARQPQFITCFGDRYGDLMCMYDHNLAMMNESYDILHVMLINNNWFPMEPFKLVYRKRFVETNMWFDDYMDYAFYLLFTKRSSMNICRLAESVLKRPTEHFNLSYMCQPSRAMRITLVRDAEKVINNCKTYPRRLLRCAFYADKKLKSTVNLILAADAFLRNGIFKLIGDPALPFNPKEGRRKRLEALPPFRKRSREMNVDWPSAMYEFDCDCCIALLCGLLSKCHRLGKKPSFEAALRLATKALADAGWLDYFSKISDLEFKDYFMGLDDAEKLRFRPEIFSFVRECVKINVFDSRYDLSDYFSDNRLREDIKYPNDVKNNDILRSMIQCNDTTVSQYVNLPKGEKLKPAGTVIGGQRVRGEGRDDPKNRYYMDRMEFPAESVKTVMINTANIEDRSASSSGSGAPANCSNCSAAARTSDSRRQCTRQFAGLPQLVGRRHANGDANEASEESEDEEDEDENGDNEDSDADENEDDEEDVSDVSCDSSEGAAAATAATAATPAGATQSCAVSSGCCGVEVTAASLSAATDRQRQQPSMVVVKAGARKVMKKRLLPYSRWRIGNARKQLPMLQQQE